MHIKYPHQWSCKDVMKAVFVLQADEIFGKYFISYARVFALAHTVLHVSNERPCINIVFASILITL